MLRLTPPLRRRTQPAAGMVWKVDVCLAVLHDHSVRVGEVRVAPRPVDPGFFDDCSALISPALSERLRGKLSELGFVDSSDNLTGGPRRGRERGRERGTTAPITHLPCPALPCTCRAEDLKNSEWEAFRTWMDHDLAQELQGMQARLPWRWGTGCRRGWPRCAGGACQSHCGCGPAADARPPLQHPHAGPGGERREAAGGPRV